MVNKSVVARIDDHPLSELERKIILDTSLAQAPKLPEIKPQDVKPLMVAVGNQDRPQFDTIAASAAPSQNRDVLYVQFREVWVRNEETFRVGLATNADVNVAAATKANDPEKLDAARTELRAQMAALIPLETESRTLGGQARNIPAEVGAAAKVEMTRKGYSQEVQDTALQDMFRAALEVGFSSADVAAASKSFGIEMQQNMQQLQNILQQMRDANAREQARLKEELEKELAKRNIDPEKIEAIAETTVKKVKEGEPVSDIIANIIAAQNIQVVDSGAIIPVVGRFAKEAPDLAEANRINTLTTEVGQKFEDDPKFRAIFEPLREEERLTSIMHSVPVRQPHNGRLEVLEVRNPYDLSTYSPVLQGALLSAYRKSLEGYSKSV